MKSFFVFYFLAINGLEVRSTDIGISINISLPGTEGSGKKNTFGFGEVVPHSFPYNARVSFKANYELFNCGGALITTEYVLTVALCPYNKGDAIVLLGGYNIDKHTDGELIIKVPKSNFILHKEWPSNYTNNIALIKLPSPIQLNEKIQLVNLPPRSLSQSQLEGEIVTACGWLQYSYLYSPILHYAQLRVTKCKGLAANICADRSGKSTCFGNSGDPLVFEESDGSRTLVGLYSFPKFDGCIFSLPIDFTFIPGLMDWISSYTGLPVKD